MHKATNINQQSKLQLVLRRLYNNSMTPLGLYSSSGILSWRRSKVLRSSGLISTLLLVLLTAAILIPLYNNNDITEAATGTAKESSLSFNLANSTASLDLSVDSLNGTFVRSSDINSVSGGIGNSDVVFSITTTNYTGYTLSISSSNNNQTLVNESNNSYTLSSITSATSYDTFSDDTTAASSYNGKWGYLPSKINSSTNTNYLPAPTTTASTLDKTSNANSSANSYTIGIGARAGYTTPAGTYTGTYILTAVGNAIAYTITYADNSGATVSGIPSAQSGSVSSTSATLSNATPTRTGYTFSKWCLGTVSNSGTTCTGTQYAKSAAFGLDQTTPNTPTLYALWTPNPYSITLTNTSATTSGSTSARAIYNTTTLYAGTSGTSAITNPSRVYTISGFSIANNNATSATVTYSTASGSNCTSASACKYTYGFKGWYTATSNGTLIINSSKALQANVSGYTGAGGIWTRTSATTLYSQWNNGSVILPTITKTGYTCGWTTTKSGATTITYSSGYTGLVPTANMTLYGVCTANKYTQTIKYRYQNATGGYGSYTTVTESVAYGTSYTWSASSKISGFDSTTYANNSTTYTVTGTKSTSLNIDRNTRTVTLTKGTGISAVTVTGNGVKSGSGTASATVYYGGTATINATLTANYVWVNWTGSATYTNQSQSISNITANKSFTANGKATLQTLTTATCPSTATAYVDSRDGTSYKIAKLADGKCWMLENLALDLTNSTVQANLSATNTNATATILGYLKNGGGTSPYTQGSVSSAWTGPNGSAGADIYHLPYMVTSGKCGGGATYCTNGSKWSSTDITDTVNNGADKYPGKVGAYYNFCAASAGSYCPGVYYDVSDYTENATYDICPKGWRLPTGGSSGEFQNLYNKYNDYEKFRNALQVNLPGYFTMGYSRNQGMYSMIWSSTYNSGSKMEVLTTHTSLVNITYGGDRSAGYSVRCVLK